MQKNSVGIVRVIFIVVAAFVAFMLLAPAGVRANPTVSAAAQPAPSQGLQNEQEQRHKRQQEYIREHSDRSGKVHPDAYSKGIEHVRQMKVAPYIGAKPLGEASPTSTK